MSLPGDDRRRPVGVLHPRDHHRRPTRRGLAVAARRSARTAPGFYSYDWLENLTGADIHNADELRPEWQQRAVGDRVPMAGAALRRLGGRRHPAHGAPAGAGAGHRRRARPVRAPAAGRRHHAPAAARAAGDPGAGRLAVGDLGPDALRDGAADAARHQGAGRGHDRSCRPRSRRPRGSAGRSPASGCSACSSRAAAGGPGCCCRSLAVVPSLALAGDLDAALAGFLAVGITVAGALAFGRRWWPLPPARNRGAARPAPGPGRVCGLRVPLRAGHRGRPAGLGCSTTVVAHWPSTGDGTEPLPEATGAITGLEGPRRDEHARYDTG